MFPGSVVFDCNSPLCLNTFTMGSFYIFNEFTLNGRAMFHIVELHTTIYIKALCVVLTARERDAMLFVPCKSSRFIYHLRLRFVAGATPTSDTLCKYS